MSFTYNPAAATGDLEWIRLTIGDTVEASARFTDEEIALIQAEVAETTTSGACQKFFVAARLIEIYVGRMGTVGAGLSRKKVDDLEVEFGSSRTYHAALLEQITNLRRDGNRCLEGGKFILRTL